MVWLEVDWEVGEAAYQRRVSVDWVREILVR
jgi:hypothetical protein